MEIKRTRRRTRGYDARIKDESFIEHSHSISEVSGLQLALNGKAAAFHEHTIPNVSGLQDALDGKAASSHGHTLGHIAGLTTALSSKSDTGHSHGVATPSAAGFMAAADKSKLDGVSLAATRSAASSSFSTTATAVQSYTAPAGEIVAGSEYEFSAVLRVVNSTVATDLVLAIAVGGVTVLSQAVPLGITDNAAPGRAVIVSGRITFYAATEAEAYLAAMTSGAAAFNIVSATSAPVTVSAGAATPIELRVSTTGTTSTVIARQATIARVK
jgi:hypothetical protein